MKEWASYVGAFTPPSWTFDGQVLELATPGTRFLRRARYQEQLTATGALPGAAPTKRIAPPAAAVNADGWKLGGDVT